MAGGGLRQPVLTRSASIASLKPPPPLLPPPVTLLPPRTVPLPVAGGRDARAWEEVMGCPPPPDPPPPPAAAPDGVASTLDDNGRWGSGRGSGRPTSAAPPPDPATGFPGRGSELPLAEAEGGGADVDGGMGGDGPRSYCPVSHRRAVAAKLLLEPSGAAGNDGGSEVEDEAQAASLPRSSLASAGTPSLGSTSRDATLGLIPPFPELLGCQAVDSANAGSEAIDGTDAPSVSWEAARSPSEDVEWGLCVEDDAEGGGLTLDEREMAWSLRAPERTGTAAPVPAPPTPVPIPAAAAVAPRHEGGRRCGITMGPAGKLLVL